MIAQSFTHRACPTCGAQAAREEVASKVRAEELSFDKLRPHWSGLFKEKVFFSYDRCQNCGLLFSSDFFTPDQLGELYSAMAPNMDLVAQDALIATQRGYWDAAAKLAPMDGGYFELGPDIGYIVEHAAREGSFNHFWLFEPNRAVHATLSAAAGGKPHTVSPDMEDFSAVPDGSIGLAVMIHVLDHLLDPLETLRVIRSKLKPDGLLMIVTHNEASLLRRIMGTRWPPFCLQHPQIYSPASIASQLKSAGYGRVDVSRSRNFFPLDFMVRQAAWTAGLKVDRVPLPKTALGLKLGNILTIARP